MKLVIRTVLFHILCIFIFAFLYYSFFKEETRETIEKKTWLDCFLFSTTIQAGVGITNIYPITYYSKITIIIQQLLMIMTNIFTLYVFNL
jgi:hypothetical protein